MIKPGPDEEAAGIGRQSADRLLNSQMPRQSDPKTKQPSLILAVGDSWFNYWPHGDVLDVIEERMGHRIERNAVAGRSLEEMLYGSPLESSEGQLAEGEAIAWLAGRIAALASDNSLELRAILLSAGGNDVAGSREVLEQLVHPKADGQPSLNDGGVAALVHGKLRRLFVTMLSCINQICDQKLTRRPWILIHGYSHPVPDGRGALDQVWLRPVLKMLGYDVPSGREVMRLLIDELNKMQRSMLAAAPKEFANVRHVDVRPALKSDDSYKLYWQNELHPTIPIGFGAVGACFIQCLKSLPESPNDELVPNAKAST